MTSLPNVHYAESMKAALMSVTDRLLLRKRAIIETVNDELKSIVQVEHSRHRCLTISSSTYSGQLLPIACFQRSRASMCKGPLTHSLHCSEFIELTLTKTTNITRNTKRNTKSEKNHCFSCVTQYRFLYLR